MKNLVKEKLANGQPVVGTFFVMGGTIAMECLGIAGVEFVIIDTEHGPFDVESAMDYIRMAELKNTTPFVRVKDATRSSILKMLDVGAMGLIIPYIETVEQVQQIVEYGKYAPVGNRGFAMARGAEYGNAPHAASVAEYYKTCNRETMLIPQCETVGCLEHIEEIAAMDGVDGIFIGPYDLSTTMGIPLQFDHPDFTAALRRIQKACKDAGIPCFIYAANTAVAKQYIAEGFQGVAMYTDTPVYIDAFKTLMKEDKGE